jgi:hypothetical protein
MAAHCAVCAVVIDEGVAVTEIEAIVAGAVVTVIGAEPDLAES